jgi:hypothetical protein
MFKALWCSDYHAIELAGMQVVKQHKNLLWRWEQLQPGATGRAGHSVLFHMIKLSETCILSLL